MNDYRQNRHPETGRFGVGRQGDVIVAIVVVAIHKSAGFQQLPEVRDLHRKARGVFVMPIVS